MPAVGELAAADQVGAGPAELVQGGQPGVRGVDGRPVPGGEDVLRLQVDEVDLELSDAGLVERGEQAVVRVEANGVATFLPTRPSTW